jgi:hypothetical protein
MLRALNRPWAARTVRSIGFATGVAAAAGTRAEFDTMAAGGGGW